MPETIELRDPDMARLIANATPPNLGDLPKFLTLGRTRDGTTREDFKASEEDSEFEDEELFVGLHHASLQDLADHLADRGRQARLEYLAVLRLQIIFESLKTHANGELSVKVWDTLKTYCAEHGVELPEPRKAVG